MRIESHYEIVAEEGGKQHAIYQIINNRRMFVGRYLQKANAEKHVARLKERWG